ncbi:hypothetical protein [Streptomyces roseolilacinus]|uniref:Lipoprotein n=1 Tax=Streptomyces roseolilacinus TaxID=66904 RepID=A0A918B674_9ACTN|nr:hypothetical protein [Streptomyces roseolilacinus]GGQ32777.1 hypothetical protein GCM10010249_59240 [Streptomyces roseolilacinus]
MGRTGLTRRRALAAATVAGVAGALAGCTGPDSGGGGAAHPSAAERARRAEAALRRRSAAVSGGLLAGYDEALGVHPALGARLGPLREAAARHVAALAPRGERAPGTAAPGEASAGTASPAPAGTAVSGTASPAPRPGTGPFPRGVPAEPGAVLGELAALASRTSAAHTAALADAPPELARLLASVAAAGAAHAYLLDEGSRA